MSAPDGSPSRALPALIGFVAMAVIAGVLVTVGVAPAIALTSVGAKNSIGLFEDLPSDLKIDPLQQGSTLYARSHGKDVKIATFYSQNRDVISWDEVGPNAKIAAVAGEDVRFYEHGGVDPTGIVRAAVQNLVGKDFQGGSTITQQYVKNVCEQEADKITDQKKFEDAFNECAAPNFSRKLREMRYAIGLEKKYTKDQILLGYLNIALFGGRIYGIQAAAKYYYDVDAKDLSISQAASLLAIVNAPNDLRLDDPKNIPYNTDRRNYILRTAYTHKMITKTQYTEALNTKITPKITPTQSGCQAAGVAGYYCDFVQRTILADKAYGSTPSVRLANLNSAGWKIYTPLNMDLQKKAMATMKTYVPMKATSAGNLASAATTVQPGTGRVLTMVQSKNFSTASGSQNTEVNYNTDKAFGGSSGFQPGSTYKLFTLENWLKEGHGLYERVDGAPRSLPASDFQACGSTYVGDPFDVHNDEAGERGFYSVIGATAASVNGAFASMAEKLDLCDIRDTAEASGVHRADGKALKYFPSTIIGTNEIAPLTMAEAYATIAAKGKYCPPVVVDRVIQTNGSKLSIPAANCTQAVDENVAIAAGVALHSVLTSGTGRGDTTFDAYGMAKTGTTDDAIATWEIGGTTTATTAVWVGNVTGYVNTRNVYSFPGCGRQAAQARHCLWREMMSANNAVYPGDTTWPQPESQFLVGKQTAVPNVAGLSVAAAKAALSAVGFQVKVGGAVASDVPQGNIATSNPAAGTQASTGATVTISPSTGTAGSVIVPNVVGQPLSAARGIIQGAGFSGGVTVAYTQGGAACTVQNLSPGVGTAVPSTTPITVTVFGNNGQCP